MRQPLTDRQRELLQMVADADGVVREAARRSGVSRSSIRKAVELAEAKGWTWRDMEAARFDMPQAPQQDVSVDELRRRRREGSAIQSGVDEDARLIPVTFKSAEPIGILFFGDPHVDDPRSDWNALEADVELVQQTDGLFAANIGDTTNNWIGRLAGKYADQDMSKRQAFTLAEWFIGSLGKDLLFSIAGNHDVWSGSGDPLEWLHSRLPGRYVPHEARFELRFPKCNPIKIAAHHSFDGSSIYNPTHAQTKAAKFHYHDYRLLISGHKHVSGYAAWPHWSGLIHHLVQLASYKRQDDYALKLGKMPQFMSPSVVMVIDPQADTEAGLITVFHDRKQGAAFLQTLRAMRKNAGNLATR